MSSISVMLANNNIIKATKRRKVKQWYQDVNKKKINLHYTSDLQNKLKVQSHITKRVDGTPLLRKDWIKNAKLCIGINRLDENSQSEKQRVISKTPELLQNNTSIREAGLNVQPRKIYYPVKQKQETNPYIFIN